MIRAASGFITAAVPDMAQRIRLSSLTMKLVTRAMKIGPPLLKVLNKTYAAEEMIRQRFGRYDLVFKTDEEGRPILLFIGQAAADGTIKGVRFVRQLQAGKDHWDNKGKV